MKKILIVNVVCGRGSTGRIAAEIGERYAREGWEVKFGDGQFQSAPERYTLWRVPIGNKWEVRIHQFLTRIFDWHGTGVCSYFATRRFVKWAEGWKPDILWLHNIHGYYLNYPMLFRWIKRHPEMEVKWTLHDCWAFTGHCSYFSMGGCEKWKTGCLGSCSEKWQYPKSWLLSAAESNWARKRKAFMGVKNLTLITPSKWLADLTRKSFLKEYPVEVVHNTIDTKVFNPTPSNVKNQLGIAGRKMILGVASTWDRRKGLQDFYRLRELLDDQYAIVLVGLASRQIATLPKGIIGIPRTNSARELAELYSAADWFFNPTLEDNYPTVNLEAIACGCKVATYDVGGCAETIEGCGGAILLRGENKSAEGFIRLAVKTETSKRK